MAIGKFENTEDSESKIEQEQPEKKDFTEGEEKQSLGDRLKEGLNKLFHKNETEESNDANDDPDGEDNPDGKDADDGEDGKDAPQNQILDTNESRKEMREKKLEEYDSQLFDTVKKHGEMLDRRTDLTQEEKNDMQTEMTENYKKAVAEYKDWLENESDYKDLPEE